MEVVGCPNHFTFLWDIWDLWNKKFIVPVVPVVPVNTKGREIVFSQHLYYFDAIEPSSIRIPLICQRHGISPTMPKMTDSRRLSYNLYLCLPTGFIGRLSEPFGFTIFLSLAHSIILSYIFFNMPFSSGGDGGCGAVPEEFNKPRF